MQHIRHVFAGASITLYCMRELAQAITIVFFGCKQRPFVVNSGEQLFIALCEEEVRNGKCGGSC